MKKSIFILSCFVLAAQSHAQSDTYTTLMKPRHIINYPQYYDSSIPYGVYKSLTNDFSASAGLVYQRSLGSKSIASKFSPTGRNTFTIDQTGAGDVNGLWFDLVGPQGHHSYKSKVTMNYMQHVVGIPIMLRNTFGASGYFFEVDTALVSRRSRMSLQEDNRNTSGAVSSLDSNTVIKNAQDAFSNPAWKYGHLVGDVSERGLDNILVKFGKTKKTRKSQRDITLQPYVAVQLPTGKEADGRYVFAPQVGSRNYAFGLGLTTLFESKQQNKSVSVDFQYRYETAAWEMRSFDRTSTKGGKWSRYMSVSYSREPNFIYPGINEMTKRTYVKQGHQAWINVQAEYEAKYAVLFLNYNLFAKQKEAVLQIEPMKDDISTHDFARVGSPAPGGVPAPGGPGTPTSMITANISQSMPDLHAQRATGILSTYTNQAKEDATFTPITIRDLDLESSMSPSYLSSTLAIGLHHYRESSFIQCGISFEAPHIGERAGYMQAGFWLRAVKTI